MKTALLAATSLLTVAIGALGALGASCAGGPATRADAPAAIRVTWRDYETGQHFELVSESHTDPVELYSEVRADASRKVQDDDAMQALLDYFHGEDYDDVAREGRAPRDGRGVVTRAIEVDRDGHVTYLAVGKSSPLRERELLNACTQGFLELYNATQAFQTVDNRGGAGLFDSQATGGR